MSEDDVSKKFLERERRRDERAKQKEQKNLINDRKQTYEMLVRSLRTYQGPWRSFQIGTLGEVKKAALENRRKPSKVRSEEQDPEDRKWLMLSPKDYSCSILNGPSASVAARQFFKINSANQIVLHPDKDIFSLKYLIDLVEKKPGRNIYGDRIYRFMIYWKEIDPDKMNDFAKKYGKTKSIVVKSLGNEKLPEPFNMLHYYQKCTKDAWFLDDKQEDQLEQDLIKKKLSVKGKPVPPVKPVFRPGWNMDSEDVLNEEPTTEEERQRRKRNEEHMTKKLADYEKKYQQYLEDLKKWEEKHESEKNQEKLRESAKANLKKRRKQNKAAIKE